MGEGKKGWVKEGGVKGRRVGEEKEGWVRGRRVGEGEEGG